VQLAASLTDQGLVNLSLDPTVGSQQLAIDSAEIGGGVALVDLLSLNAVLAQSAESPEFTLEASNFSMAFDPFLLGGDPTGPNAFEMILPNRTAIGTWDFTGGGQDVSFAFAGDALWTNQLFPGLDEDGYAIQSFSGSLLATSSTAWTGTATIEGGLYAPVPEPSTLALLSFGWWVLVLGRSRTGAGFQRDR